MTGTVSARVQSLRDWLKRVMPSVAIIAATLFIIWLMVRRTGIYQRHDEFTLFGFLTLCVVGFTVSYFGLKALLWLKRGLLWRVRRRLLITYLFVGLTPILLLGALGTLAWFAVSNEAMSRVVTAQITETERSVAANASAIAEAYAAQPPLDEKSAKAWLNEKMRFLQKSHPGAWVVLKSEPTSKAANTGKNGLMIVSAPADTDEIHQLGPAADSDATLFPEWIWAKSDWSGLAFLPPPEGSNTAFGSPSFRAFVHGKAHETPFIVLVIVPVNRAFISQVTKTTGIDVRPFFLGAKSAGVKRGSHSVTIGDENMKQTEETEREWESKGEMGSNGKFELDQLGRPMSAAFPILLNSTNWLTGDQSERLAFMFGWSWAEAQKHLLEGGTLGDLFRKILIAVGIGFLVLEVLALLSAGWMTRAVTGTVHKLYRATRYINRGDFSHRVRVRSHDQLGELAGAFNEMSSNIETLLKERVERERLQREVEIAAEVQAQLFPAEVPKLSTVGLSGECRAARGVAGDYYDYVEIEPGLVTIALGDVSGKGISASLVMSNLQASVRAQSSMIAERVRAGREFTVSAVAASGEGTSTFHLPMTNHDCSVGKIASSINHQLCGSTGANRFATLFIGIYDDHTRTMSYTNAGHNAPMLVRAGGTIERLAVGGMMVGAFDWAKYDEAVIRLNPDDLLLVFSDGITEAERATGEEFSEERLAQFVLKNRHLSTKDLCEAIFHEIEAWSGTAERADDQTLVIMKAAA